MFERLTADAIVAAHAAFIAYACLGGILAWRHPAWSLAHLPAAAWAAWVEWTASICPLTPLENHWRRLAGEAGYDGGFVERYLIPLVYPPGLTPRVQAWLAAGLVALNVAIYAWAWVRWRARRESASP
ncbi:MAG: DUF2784 domain-containing protein [Burkholderiales bacterium]|nr:DUF2784 domain-containing protein [Burkholderiales bacterium]